MKEIFRNTAKMVLFGVLILEGQHERLISGGGALVFYFMVSKNKSELCLRLTPPLKSKTAWYLNMDMTVTYHII